MKFFQRRTKKGNAEDYGELLSGAFSSEMPPTPAALQGPSRDLSSKKNVAPPSQELSRELQLQSKKNAVLLEEAPEEEDTSFSSTTEMDDLRVTRMPSSSTVSTLPESPPASPRGRRGMNREESTRSVATAAVTGQVQPRRDRRSSFKRITSQRSRNPRRRIHERTKATRES